jgi:Gpi18-like mannosyltransferase
VTLLLSANSVARKNCVVKYEKSVKIQTSQKNGEVKMINLISKDKTGIFWVLLTACASAGFYVVITRFEEISVPYAESNVIGLLLTFLFFTMGMVIANTMKPPNEQLADNIVKLVFFLIMAAGLTAVRGSLLYYRSADYISYLSQWVEAYRGMSIREGLGTNVGNYNMPYMYILLGISRIDFTPLYYIKFVSAIFDILLAYFVMKLAELKTDNMNFRLAAFIGTLAIPTVILNSSMWAQCDSIYAALTVGALYYALKGKSKSAFIFMGLAFSFKLHAVFVLPMFFFFILKGKLRLKDAWLLPAVIIASLLPAVAAGMPVSEAFSAYFNQFGYFSRLNMNAISIWRLTGWVNEAHFITAGLFVAGTALTALIYFIYVNRERITHTADYINMAYLFAVILPFTLPKMHDRYLFLADVLSLLVFAFNKKRWFVPLVTIGASYISYVFYLMGGVTLIDYVYVSLALGIVLIVVLKDLAAKLYKPV